MMLPSTEQLTFDSPSDARLSSEPVPSDLAGDVRYRWPRSLDTWLVAIYMGLFIIRPWEVIAPWLGEIRFERVYALLMILVVVFSGRVRLYSRQCIAVAAFLAAVAMSAAFAFQPTDSWQPLYRFATVAATYFLLMATMRQIDDLFFFATTYITTMWLYISKSLWEYIVHGRHEYAQSVPRLIGIDLTYGEPNAVAMSVVVSLPIWLFLWRRCNSLTEGWGRMWKRGFYLITASYPVLSFVAVLLTNSRAGMVGFAAFIILSGVHCPKPKSLAKTVALGMVLVCVLWIITPQQQKDRLRTLWDPTAGPSNAQASADGRWAGFVAALQMFQRDPITGVGIGNFVNYRVSFLDGVPKVAHNLPGQVLGEFGVLGAVAFGSMIWIMWRNCRRAIAIDREIPTTEADDRIELAFAIANVTLLLLFFGLSLHNALRFNWLWMAAFAAFLVTESRNTQRQRSGV